jgi:hypothetical protein
MSVPFACHECPQSLHATKILRSHLVSTHVAARQDAAKQAKDDASSKNEEYNSFESVSKVTFACTREAT